MISAGLSETLIHRLPTFSLNFVTTFFSITTWVKVNLATCFRLKAVLINKIKGASPLVEMFKI